MHTLSTGNMLIWVVALLMVYSLESSFGHRKKEKVKENDCAELKCDVPCHGYIEWVRDCSKWMKKVLPNECQQEICGEADVFKIDQGRSSLLLNPAVYTNTGHYKCYCNNSVLCEVRLHVDIDRAIGGNAGENVTLHCHVCPAECTAKHNIPIQWTKDGWLLPLWGHEETDASKYEVGHSVLNIFNFMESDEGVYCCYCGKIIWCYIVLKEEMTNDTGN